MPSIPGRIRIGDGGLLVRGGNLSSTRRLEDRISLLKRAAKLDRDNQRSITRWVAYPLEQNTISSRAAARKWLKKAMVLGPENITYHESYATLLRRQGFGYNSMRHFRKILAMDPERPEAACEVGEYFLQDMLKYIDHRRFDGGGSLRSFGMESLDQAISYFKYALRRDSYCRRAYYRLGFLNLEAGHLDGLVEVSNELTKRFPNDPNGFFFLGLGYQGMGDLERAAGSYSKAVERMSPSQREMIESPELIGLVSHSW